MPHPATMSTLRRMDSKVDSINNEVDELMEGNTTGENADPTEFMQLMEKRVTAQQAMQAQFKLNEKPLKTVLNETR